MLAEILQFLKTFASLIKVITAFGTNILSSPPLAFICLPFSKNSRLYSSSNLFDGI